MCFRMQVRGAFEAFIEMIERNKFVQDSNLLSTWKTFVDTTEHQSRQKSSQGCWEANYYHERVEEHMRLKQSLFHPSHHYTFDALKKSWHGTRSEMGPFGDIAGRIHTPSTATSSIFGIELAV